MRHRRVAGDGDLLDLVELDAVTPLQLFEQVVDGLHDEALQAREAALSLREDDARDDVLAAGDLLVVGAGRVDHATRLEFDEIGHHRGGADVHGEAHALLAEGARVDADQPGGR